MLAVSLHPAGGQEKSSTKRLKDEDDVSEAKILGASDEMGDLEEASKALAVATSKCRPLKKNVLLSVLQFLPMSFADVSYERRSPGSVSSSGLSRRDSWSNANAASKKLDSSRCSENQSLLGAVGTLDWLFAADSEPEPPSSPKLVATVPCFPCKYLILEPFQC